MSKVIVRPATREDIDAYSDMADKPTIRALVGVIDGRVIAIGGLALVRGRYYAFCDLTDEARAYKLHVMRAAKRLLAEARRDGIKYVYAQASLVEPKAVAWLTSLGFSLDPRSEHLYRWSAD